MERNTELKVVGIGVVVLIAIALGVGLVMGNAAPETSAFASTVTTKVSNVDHVRGNQTSEVSVIEYGDFQCPACGAYEPIVEELTKQYGDRVAFVFRHFPLTQVHQNAMISSQAAEAAGLQGKFWEMHDLLYAKQTEWSNEPTRSVVSKYFDGYAKQIGLDVVKFNADINSDAVTSKIQNDITAANQARVDHTPTFFVNLEQIANPRSLQEFQKVIEGALLPKTIETTATTSAQ